ncbi:unnamed protein product [Dibothriocephalus latus]|uniref:Uncharacterized protein n=1 Tax=Dibothriocephalus latus TaxID=60516 RepID=A0A3P7MEW6_DIBLA|nr:unnamed protein product [Dibothriocephalus latus]
MPRSHTCVRIEYDLGYLNSNVHASLDGPEIKYPEPPPKRPGKFRYSLFSLFSYVGMGNCCFFCLFSLLGFEEIMRVLGYIPPFSFWFGLMQIPASCFCGPCVMCNLRRKFRKKWDVRGNILLDFIFSLFCCCCVANQLLNESRAIIITKEVSTSSFQLPNKRTKKKTMGKLKMLNV